MTNELVKHITVEESTSIEWVNPIALRKAKIEYNFGLSEDNRVNNQASWQLISIKGKDGWMEDLPFYVLFNNTSVILGQWELDNERLCAMELCLQLRRFRLERGSNTGLLDQ